MAYPFKEASVAFACHFPFQNSNGGFAGRQFSVIPLILNNRPHPFAILSLHTAIHLPVLQIRKRTMRLRTAVY